MSEDRSYCCDEFEKALKEERLRPGIGRYWFYEISQWVYECPFCHTCPFCNRKLATVTLAEITELSARLRDTSRQTLYETKLRRWLESKGFVIEEPVERRL